MTEIIIDIESDDKTYLLHLFLECVYMELDFVSCILEMTVLI